MPVIMRISHAPQASQVHGSHLKAPMLMRPLAEYTSPIDGKLITSRAERNEDCKRSGSIPWEKGIGQKAGATERTPGLYKNPRFARKRNLPLSEEGQKRAMKEDKNV